MTDGDRHALRAEPVPEWKEPGSEWKEPVPEWKEPVPEWKEPVPEWRNKNLCRWHMKKGILPL